MICTLKVKPVIYDLLHDIYHTAVLRYKCLITQIFVSLLSELLCSHERFLKEKP